MEELTEDFEILIVAWLKSDDENATNLAYSLAKHAQSLQLLQPDVSCWVAFDWMKIETRPTAYGKYLICRKDGKIHWETWNGSGWAYNHNEIRFWAVIVPPCS